MGFNSPFPSALYTLFDQFNLVKSAILCALIGWSGSNYAQTFPSGFSQSIVMAGWNAPVGAAWDDNDRMYVWEKRGMVWVVDNGVKLTPALLDIREEVANWRDHGMLGFALDPDFLVNGHIYVLYGVDRHHLMNFGTPAYNSNINEYYAATIMRITRYTATVASGLTQVDPATRTVLLGETPQTGVPLLHESHSTGSLMFGDDGTLLASVGDGASYSSTDVGSANETYYAQALIDGIIRPEENVGAFRSQMVNSLNGKILRLDPTTGDGVPSNPFFSSVAPRSAASRVWALGLRNPYRTTIHNGTGSTNPADADPGTLYIGDVGWGLWEDLNVCNEPGMNFGWPIFEGLENHSGYTNAVTPNMDAPNPWYNGTTCTQQFFNFQDLLVQDSPLHLGLWPNPCDPSQQIPINIPKFKHARPAIDWRHGQDIARCGSFNGNTATVHNLNSAGSPVSGPEFRGNAALGGPVIAGNGWPAGYQNVNMSADYVSGWIRRFVFDANEQAVSVHDFASGLGNITWLGEGPDGCVWYLRYNSSDLRKICYTQGANLPPVAVASQDLQYGSGPLTVNFTGSNSSDPENQPLTYLWDFGDGNSSTMSDPSHIFNATPGVPTTYTITLTVTDDQNQTDITTLIVAVNNTPPVVNIISFPDSALYPVGIDTLFSLEANVTDAEHGPSELSYSWRTTLHHNTHVHHEPEDDDVITNTLISGIGCYDETYYYKIRLIVTDDDGLSTTVTHTLLPNCAAIGPIAIIQSNGFSGYAPFAVDFSGTQSFDPGGIVGYDWDFGDGTTSTQPEPSHVYTTSGTYTVTLTVTDGDGLQDMTTGTITVVGLEPPSCTGPAGELLREYWNGILGNDISALLINPNYPDSPDGSNAITAFQGPQNWGSNYGTRVRGYIIAPEDGQYIFNITGDDDTRFYLSLNADPANKQLVAQIDGWTNPTEFSKYSSQRSAPINLVANTYYYVELLHKEGGGGDHFAVYWETPSNPSLNIVGSQHIAGWTECPPALSATAMLQGPFDQVSGMMRDDLRADGHIPLTEPFTSAGFIHVGGGGETTTNTVLSTTGPDAIVDWIMLELRDKSNPATVVATASALIQRDGDIVSPSGEPQVVFGSAVQDQYHVAIRHRNHLAIMTANPIAFTNASISLNMVNGVVSIYGSDPTFIAPTGEHLMWCGNVNPDGVIKYTGSDNDRDPMLGVIGSTVTNTVSGYYPEDVNLDSEVKYIGSGNDRDLILINIGGSIPTNTRTEQLP